MTESKILVPWTTETLKDGRVYMHGPGCPEPDGEFLLTGEYRCILKNEAYALGRNSRDKEFDKLREMIKTLCDSSEHVLEDYLSVPKKKCRCHLMQPCSNCETRSGFGLELEIISAARKSIKEV